jgi:catechol 2,3-dioxygenase-like lactoylglutathione lyase family enzyme
MVIRKVFHVALDVRNLMRSVDFYTNVIGMKVVSFEEVPADGARVAFLSLGEMEMEICAREGWEKKQFADGSISHFPHLAFEVDDVEESMQELRRKGVTFDNEQPRFIFDGKVCYNTFRGPDGETLEISRRMR